VLATLAAIDQTVAAMQTCSGTGMPDWNQSFGFEKQQVFKAILNLNFARYLTGIAKDLPKVASLLPL